MERGKHDNQAIVRKETDQEHRCTGAVLAIGDVDVDSDYGDGTMKLILNGGLYGFNK